MKIVATCLISYDDNKQFCDELEKIVKRFQDEFNYDVEVQFSSTSLSFNALVIGRK